MKNPCLDCITYIICKNQLHQRIQKAHSQYGQTLNQRVMINISIGKLYSKCTLIQDYHDQLLSANVFVPNDSYHYHIHSELSLTQQQDLISTFNIQDPT